MRTNETNKDDAVATALMALAWVLGEDERAGRLMALTGLDPGDLRERISDNAVLSAVLNFLASHESDLIACASAIGIKPETLIIAQERLDQ
jgi:hypothetical protein